MEIDSSQTPTEIVKVLREAHGPDAFRESTAKVTASKLRGEMRKQKQSEDRGRIETVRTNGKANAKKLFRETATEDNSPQPMASDGHQAAVLAFASYEQLLSEQKAKVATLEACVTQFEAILDDWKAQQ